MGTNNWAKEGRLYTKYYGAGLWLEDKMKQWKFSIKGLGWNTNEEGKFWKEDEWWGDNETGLKHQKNKKKPIWECYGYYMCGKYQKGEFHAGLGSEKKLRNIRVFPNSLALCEGWLSSHLCLAGGLIIIVDVWVGIQKVGKGGTWVWGACPWVWVVLALILEGGGG